MRCVVCRDYFAPSVTDPDRGACPPCHLIETWSERLIERNPSAAAKLLDSLALKARMTAARRIP